MQRLDKIVALNCGVSRTDAKKLIKNGAVSVNGAVVLKGEASVDPQADSISVNGKSINIKEHVYIMLNKPSGVISASNDPNEKTVVDLVPEKLFRRSLAPCGRLDKDTTGLLILSDDGDFVHRIISPAHHVYKTYIARLDKPLSPESVKLLESGITLGDGTQCLPAKIRTFTENSGYYAEIKIREGKYHQVKRMCAACGSTVTALDRIAAGKLKLDPALERGECRELTEEEINMIFTDISE